MKAKARGVELPKIIAKERFRFCLLVFEVQSFLGEMFNISLYAVQDTLLLKESPKAFGR